MAKTKKAKYVSKNFLEIKRLLKEIYNQKIYDYGYPSKLGEMAGCSKRAAWNTLTGISIKTEIVIQLLTELEKSFNIKKSMPEKLDLSDLTLQQIVEQKLLPNGYGKLASQNSTLTAATIRQMKTGHNVSKNAETALRELAAYNIEMEMRHRLTRIVDA